VFPCPAGVVPVALGNAMKSFGMWMVILSLGSFLLNFMGMDFMLVSWMDSWGATMGIVLRLVAAAIGAALWFFGSKQDAGATPVA
jgi:hypothetical protein